MPDPECPHLTPGQERAIKLAVESSCEICSTYSSPDLLVLHLISKRKYREMVRDPSTRFLVVCADCHDKIHRPRIRVKDLRTVVACRSFFVRQDLRRALGYRPRPYTAPGPSGSDEIGDGYFFSFRPEPIRPVR